MSYEIPEEFEPVLDTDLPAELHDEFHVLYDEICAVCQHDDFDDIDSAAERLYQHIKESVSAHPILARTVYVYNHRKWTLLKIVCDRTLYLCHKAIKFLIEANPHALLWADTDNKVYRGPIYMLTGHTDNFVLFPWIVERYPWIFKHELCQQYPPHLSMVKCSVNDLSCCLEHTQEIRKFYELYPEGLAEKGEEGRLGNPLMVSLTGRHEPDADLFIWMAEQYPEAVHDDYGENFTLLHEVCASLAEKRDTHLVFPKPFKCSPNMAKICRFLISKHPQLIRQKDDDGYLPIHMLAHRCNRPIVQQIVILLLKAYPECVQVKAGNVYSELSRVRFIRRVHPLILAELAIEEEIALLVQCSQNMVDATDLPANNFGTSTEPIKGLHSSLFNSVSEVFRCWVELRISGDLLPEKQIYQSYMKGFCNIMDVSDEIAELVDWDEADDNDLNEIGEEDDNLNRDENLYNNFEDEGDRDGDPSVDNLGPDEFSEAEIDDVVDDIDEQVEHETGEEVRSDDLTLENVYEKADGFSTEDAGREHETVNRRGSDVVDEIVQEENWNGECASQIVDTRYDAYIEVDTCTGGRKQEASEFALEYEAGRKRKR
ncbi:hypothetical protein FisN_14Hh221 [Fistulifera solaris]|jgi:hypothetical protein|uniref:Uncharacterized protein n=1 Tax=Fistulifera solaris TaxID=1519565 RepID=A0A1Z5K8L8_FISSO|nr:hypothetical protein FisN_14Hh221 [Fistulifera solaris]|eukprot:GAX22589.1 hypothetical protein FisN_14Hh221 [Fistulifera solaris]